MTTKTETTTVKPFTAFVVGVYFALLTGAVLQTVGQTTTCKPEPITMWNAVEYLTWVYGGGFAGFCIGRKL